MVCFSKDSTCEFCYGIFTWTSIVSIRSKQNKGNRIRIYTSTHVQFEVKGAGVQICFVCRVVILFQNIYVYIFYMCCYRIPTKQRTINKSSKTFQFFFYHVFLNKHVVTMSTQLALTQTSSHTFVRIENWFTTFLIKYTWHSFTAKQFVDSPIKYNECMLHCWHWNAAVNLRFMLL